MMDAFVTKMADASVNKGVFVSTSGYQAGARRVAIDHGIDLFQLTFLEGPPTIPKHAISIALSPLARFAPPRIEIKRETVGNVVETIALRYANGKTVSLPEEPSQMRYYASKSLAGGVPLDKWIEEASTRPVPENEFYTAVVPVGAMLVPPDDYFIPSGKLSSIKIKVCARMGKVLGGNVQIEPSAFAPQVRYENIETGATFASDVNQLPMGPTRLEEGEFYFSYFPLKYFYCEKVEADIMTISVIESFQNGHLMRGTFTQNDMYSFSYLPVTDKKILVRLRKRLDDLNRLNALERSQRKTAT